MGIVIRQGIKGTIGSYIGVVIGAFNLLWLYPKILDPSEIGFLRVLQDIGFLLAILSQFGIGSITDRFFPYFKDTGAKHKGFFLFILFYPLIGFFLISFLFYLFSDLVQEFFTGNSPLLTQYIYYLIPLSFFMIYQKVLESYLRAHYNISFPVLTREVFLRIFLALIVIFYALDWYSTKGLVISLVISYAAAALILVVYVIRLRFFFLEAFSVVKNLAMLKRMVIFGLFIFTLGVVGVLNAKVDVIMLSGMVDLDATGIYSVAFFIGTVIEIPRRALSSISVPIIASAWKEWDIEKIREIYWKSSLNLSIAGILLFLMIFGNIHLIFDLVPNSDVYRAGVMVVLYIGLSRVFDMLTGVNVEIIMTSEFYKTNFALGLSTGVLNVLLNYLLIPPMQMEGAALATLITIVVTNILRMAVVYKELKIHPFTAGVAYLIFFGCILYAVLHFTSIAVDSLYLSILLLIIRTSLTAIVFLGAIYLLKLSDDFNETANKFFNMLRK